MQQQLKQDVDEYRDDESSTPNRVTSRWNNDEVMLAIQGKYYLVQIIHSNCI